MTVYKLINMHNMKHLDSHFFDRDTLRFFGERISEMRVLKQVEIIKDWRGNEHKCYVLSSIQHNAPEGVEKRKHHYFDIDSFDVIHN